MTTRTIRILGLLGCKKADLVFETVAYLIYFGVGIVLGIGS